MTLSPIIAREFRVESRRAVTWSIRVLTALVLAIAFVTVLFGISARQGVSGDQVFWRLHAALFNGIWIVVPAITADCISRERRDNTLGLLFLTPLTPTDVAFGKSTVQILRAMMMLGTALPFLMLCLALGGVEGFQVILAAAFNFTALNLALAAGLIASAYSRRLSRAMIAAEVLSAVMLFLYLHAHVGTAIGSAAPVGLPGTVVISALSAVHWWAIGSDLGNLWQYLPLSNASDLRTFWLSVSISTLLSFGVLLLSVVAAGNIMRRSFRDAPVQSRPGGFLRGMITPLVFGQLLGSVNRYSLSRAPLRWLQNHSWNARLTKWGWCTVIVVAESILSAQSSQSALFFQPVLALALLLGISFTGASSYRIERDNGVLELVLVSPIREASVVRTRLMTIARQFLPAFAVLTCVWFHLATTYSFPIAHFGTWLLFLVYNVTAAAGGLYFALLLPNVLTAWIATICATILAPAALMFITPGFAAGSFLVSLGLACMFIYHTIGDLARRRFALG